MKDLIGLHTIRSDFPSSLLPLVLGPSLEPATSPSRVTGVVWCTPRCFYGVILALFLAVPRCKLDLSEGVLGPVSEHSAALWPGFPQQKHISCGWTGEVISDTIAGWLFAGGSWAPGAKLVE